MNAPARVTPEGHTGFLHLPSAVLAFVFVVRRIQSSLYLVDRKVDFVYPRTNRSSLAGHRVFCANIRTHVPTSKDFEVNN